MTSDDDYAFEGAATQPARDNNPPLSISELSFALSVSEEDALLRLEEQLA